MAPRGGRFSRNWPKSRAVPWNPSITPFGGADLYVTFDLPDTATAAAISLSIGAGGALDITTVQLITPEEIDAACGKKVSYRPPGA